MEIKGISAWKFSEDSKLIFKGQESFEKVI